MVADFELDDLTTIENDYGSRNELLAHRKVIPNPLAEYTIEQLLHMPAHEIHKTGVMACNGNRPSINTGQTAATTQIARVVDPHSRKNLTRIDVKPAARKIDVSEYMMSNLSDYGLDVDCPIIASFEEEEAPYSDFDVGDFTHTHANVSPLREHNSGPITNALATAAELIADIKEAGEDAEPVAEAVEKLWGCTVTLRESGLIPETGNRSVRRLIAEQNKNSYYVYGNEGQLSMFVASTAQNWDIFLPNNEALDFHRMRYIAKAACYLDYVSTAGYEAKKYYHTVQHYFGYRPGQVLHLHEPLVSLKVPDKIEMSKVMWLPPMLVKNLTVTEQVKRLEVVLNRDYFHIKELLQEVGEETVRELLNTTLTALKRSTVRQPGFGKKSERGMLLADTTYEIRAPSLSAMNIASTSIVQLLVNALTAKYIPGQNGERDGWFKECVKLARRMYADELGNKELMIISHRLDGICAEDLIAHMSNEATTAGYYKETKSQILARMRGWISRLDLVENNLHPLSKPWFIAHIIYNKVDSYLNKLNYLMGTLIEATSGFKVEIDPRKDIVSQINALIIASNKHIAYFADTYKARGEALRDLGRIHSTAYKPGMEFEYIHASRFMRCVKFKFGPSEVTFEIDMTSARSDILHTLKTANIIVSQELLSSEPNFMFEELKRTTTGVKANVVLHLQAGYLRAVKYLKWRHQDLLRQVDPYLKQIQETINKKAKMVNKKRKKRGEKMHQSASKIMSSRAVTFRGVTKQDNDKKGKEEMSKTAKYVPPHKRAIAPDTVLPYDPKLGTYNASKLRAEQESKISVTLPKVDTSNMFINLGVERHINVDPESIKDQEANRHLLPSVYTNQDMMKDKLLNPSLDVDNNNNVISNMELYAKFVSGTKNTQVNAFHHEQMTSHHLKEDQKTNPEVVVSRDINVVVNTDMSRYAFALAEQERQNMATIEEDQLTAREVNWAENNGVKLNTVIVFNANAINEGDPILDDLLADNPYLPPSRITGAVINLDTALNVDSDIKM